MKTPLQELKQELLDEVDLTPELRKFIGRINHIYLEKEKQAIIDAHCSGELCKKEIGTLTTRSNDYYNQKYNK